MVDIVSLPPESTSAFRLLAINDALSLSMRLDRAAGAVAEGDVDRPNLR
jgi:hypothetical protein